jgi:hypothetical protein
LPSPALPHTPNSLVYRCRRWHICPFLTHYHYVTLKAFYPSALAISYLASSAYIITRCVIAVWVSDTLGEIITSVYRSFPTLYGVGWLCQLPRCYPFELNKCQADFTDFAQFSHKRFRLWVHNVYTACSRLLPA